MEIRIIQTRGTLPHRAAGGGRVPSQKAYVTTVVTPDIRDNTLLPLDNTYNHAIVVASQAITRDY